jgi:hypothetical protein
LFAFAIVFKWESENRQQIGGGEGGREFEKKIQEKGGIF